MELISNCFRTRKILYLGDLFKPWDPWFDHFLNNFFTSSGIKVCKVNSFHADAKIALIIKNKFLFKRFLM